MIISLLCSIILWLAIGWILIAIGHASMPNTLRKAFKGKERGLLNNYGFLLGPFVIIVNAYIYFRYCR